MSLRNLAATAAVFARQRADLAGNQDANLSPIHTDVERQEGSPSQPLLRNDAHASASVRYGAVEGVGSTSEDSHSRKTSPEVHRREGGLNRVPEEVDTEGEDGEAEYELEWNLEAHGLYAGMSCLVCFSR